MESQFSTPSKDCIQEEVVVVTTNKKRDSHTPDISHLVYIKRTWKAELLLSTGMTRVFEHKADGLNEFLNIMSEKFKKGYKILSIIGGG